MFKGRGAGVKLLWQGVRASDVGTGAEVCKSRIKTFSYFAHKAYFF